MRNPVVNTGVDKMLFSAAASDARRRVGSSRPPTLKGIARKLGIEEQ